MPPIAPAPLSVRATAPIHATGRAHDSRRSRPAAPRAAAITERDDRAIDVNSTASTRPTADGSFRKPLTNRAHHTFTAAPASKAAQSQAGVAGRSTAGRAWGSTE